MDKLQALGMGILTWTVYAVTFMIPALIWPLRDRSGAIDWANTLVMWLVIVPLSAVVVIGLTGVVGAVALDSWNRWERGRLRPTASERREWGVFE